MTGVLSDLLVFQFIFATTNHDYIITERAINNETNIMLIYFILYHSLQGIKIDLSLLTKIGQITEAASDEEQRNPRDVSQSPTNKDLGDSEQQSYSSNEPQSNLSTKWDQHRLTMDCVQVDDENEYILKYDNNFEYHSNTSLLQLFTEEDKHSLEKNHLPQSNIMMELMDFAGEYEIENMDTNKNDEEDENSSTVYSRYEEEREKNWRNIEKSPYYKAKLVPLYEDDVANYYLFNYNEEKEFNGPLKDYLTELNEVKQSSLRFANLK
jgi:hypothetical protein